jgi:hypothetical protein
MFIWHLGWVNVPGGHGNRTWRLAVIVVTRDMLACHYLLLRLVGMAVRS